MRPYLATVLSAALIFAPFAQATEIRQFDRYDGDDQIRFVDKLVDSVEAAAKNDPAQLAKVKRFFMNKQPGEAISGMGRFELNLSLARIADMDASAKNPKARHLEVEDVMYATLFNNGLRFSNSFRPVAVDFQPQKPLGRPLTRQDADKALAQTRQWIARTVEPEHRFDHGGPVGETEQSWSGWSDDQKAIAFFAAIIALGYLVGGSGHGSTNSGAYDPPIPPDTRTFDQMYRDAQRTACAATLDTNCRDMFGNPW